MYRLKRFRGEYEVKVDGKNRIQLPVAMRKQFEELGEIKFILARGTRQSLVFCPEAVWEQTENDVMELHEDDPMIDEYRQLKLGGADFANIDTSGRLLLPATLKRHASIKEDVIIAAVGEKFVIRDAVIYNEFFEKMTQERERELTAHASVVRQEMKEKKIGVSE